MKERRNFFDDSAPGWDETCDIMKSNPRLDELVFKFGIGKGRNKIIDMGCGTGIISERLLELTGREGEIFCCDLSMKMLRIARRKRNSSLPVSPGCCREGRILHACADVHNLPFRSNFFDYMVCFSCFPHFENKKKALGEINRILKKGGCLIISHLLSSKEIADVHGKAGHAVSGDRMPPKNSMVGTIKAAGFKILEFQDRQGLYMLRAEKLHT